MQHYGMSERDDDHFQKSDAVSPTTIPTTFTEQARQLVQEFSLFKHGYCLRRVRNEHCVYCETQDQFIARVASLAAEAATQGQATSDKFTEGSTEDFSDPAGQLIKELNRKRKAHLMGDCAGDTCPDWIDEQIKIIATFASEVARYSQIDGQAVGIERAAELAEKSHPQPCTCTTCLIHAEIALAIRKISPDPSYLSRVRNEAATAALEQAAQIAARADVWPIQANKGQRITEKVRALKLDAAAIGDDKEQ